MRLIDNRKVQFGYRSSAEAYIWRQPPTEIDRSTLSTFTSIMKHAANESVQKNSQS